MSIEIERKYRVVSDGYRSGRSIHIMQGYICSAEDKVVRVRIADDKAFLTIKDATVGFARHEFEYSIPLQDAMLMLDDVCIQPIIDKTRWIVECGGKIWEVDEFHGDNEGLVVAEIELENADECFAMPDWIGAEVTGKPQYYNACLFSHPFSQWSDEEKLI